jgi:hypothetical protein
VAARVGSNRRDVRCCAFVGQGKLTGRDCVNHTGIDGAGYGFASCCTDPSMQSLIERRRW